MVESPNARRPTGVVRGRPPARRRTMGRTTLIKDYLYAWRYRGTEKAMREIGRIVMNEPRRAFPCVELRERTRLRRGLMYRTLESLVDVEWLGVDAVRIGGRRVSVYYVAERGKLCFPSLLTDHDIHSGDKSWRQVWSELCVSNVWTPFTSRSSAKQERR